MPPLAGFMGKALLLQSAGAGPWGGGIVAAILVASLLTMAAFARSGSMLFWKPHDTASSPGTPPLPPPATVDASMPTHAAHGASLAMLALLLAACAVLAAPVSRYTAATAQQLFDTAGYRRAVLGAQPVPAAFDLRLEMRQRKESRP
jgi:multicomponent K+:H+ antiporter subunit D